MEDQTTTPPEQDQPGPVQADASIDLRMEGEQLLVNISSPQDHLSNQAVHFAHWVGRNLAALKTLALQDLLAQARIHDQAKAIADLTAPKEQRPVIELPVRALRGPDGERLQ